MIIKSMSRKVPSFGQLLEYIDRDAGQEAYSIRHNLAGRKSETIRAEFERNGELLKKRKNGNYLFHEIISITRAKGLSPEEKKSRLQEIAQEYINARCPDNLVYGGLHQDKDHSYHMHLMISANRAGQEKRQQLSKHQFRQIQVKLEEHVLQHYPELEQKLAIGKRSDRGRTKGEAELERRTKSRPKREEILERVQTAFDTSNDRDSLLNALGYHNLELYVRGKTLGVIDHETGKKHRLKTLDLEIADRVEIRLSGQEIEPAKAAERDDAQEQVQEAEFAGQKRKAPEGQQAVEPQHQGQRRDEAKERTMRDSDKEKDTVKQEAPQYGSDENIKRRQEIEKGERTPDPEMDIMTHEDWRKQDHASHKFAQSWRRTIDDLRGKDRSEEKSRDKDRDR